MYRNRSFEQLIKQTSHFSENENWLPYPQASVTVINVCEFEILCLCGSVRAAIEIVLSHNSDSFCWLLIQKSYVNTVSYRWAKWHKLYCSVRLVSGDREGGVLSSAQLINITLPWLHCMFVITTVEGRVQIWVAHYIGTPFLTATLPSPGGCLLPLSAYFGYGRGTWRQLAFSSLSDQLAWIHKHKGVREIHVFKAYKSQTS